MSFGGGGFSGFGQQNQNQSSGFGGFGSNTNNTGSGMLYFSSHLILCPCTVLILDVSPPMHSTSN